ncbi:hypothetical protein OSSY52_22460 [Tepiditoga spiralis]|uniref:TIGR00374 family protein n=1 Tax=Tepiditoga spiralis TaxID=2108365 RepID=A0A7G1G7C7_9BACT|nr:lysylphosphatidylglycerol synthase transmembrane domain-containing protein [Tepiditoga spiralis]BBE32105.1 hypothetical protein OSSY52_22460 [Tepiditoga spiralis]
MNNNNNNNNNNNDNPFENKKKYLINIVLVIIIGLLTNISMAFFSDFKSIISILKNANYLIVLKAFLIYSLIYLIDVFRTKLVLRSMNFKIKFKDALYNSVSGYFIANLTPMASGGQPYQIYHLTKLGVDSKTSTNIIFSRLIEFLIFSTVTVLIFLKKILEIMNGEFLGSKVLIIGLIASMGITIFILSIFINPKIIYRTLHFLNKIFRFKRGKKLLENLENWTDELRESISFLWKERFLIVLIDFALGVLSAVFQTYAFFVVLTSLTGKNFDFFSLFLIFILLNFVIYYVPTPGSSGGVEGIYNMVLVGFVGTPHYVTAAIFLWRFTTYYLQIAFQIIVLLISRRKMNESSRVDSNLQ